MADAAPDELGDAEGVIDFIKKKVVPPPVVPKPPPTPTPGKPGKKRDWGNVVVVALFLWALSKEG